MIRHAMDNQRCSSQTLFLSVKAPGHCPAESGDVRAPNQPPEWTCPTTSPDLGRVRIHRESTFGLNAAPITQQHAFHQQRQALPLDRRLVTGNVDTAVGSLILTNLTLRNITPSS